MCLASRSVLYSPAIRSVSLAMNDLLLECDLIFTVQIFERSSRVSTKPLIDAKKTNNRMKK